ncbi:MAG: hypothetical protein JXA03_00645 [Bacteroidales bacterium]|nr:hypothetical protein [Bacteroidales bacterium]
MKVNKIAKKGLDEINKHKGKKLTYETYMKVDPEIAQKYVEFVGTHLGVQYIRWDTEKKRFVA